MTLRRTAITLMQIGIFLLVSLACGPASQRDSVPSPSTVEPISVATLTARADGSNSATVEPTSSQRLVTPLPISPSTVPPTDELASTNAQIDRTPEPTPEAPPKVPNPTPWAAWWEPPFRELSGYNLFLDGPPSGEFCPNEHLMCSSIYEGTVWFSEPNWPSGQVPFTTLRMSRLGDLTDPIRITHGDDLIVAYACKEETSLVVVIDYQVRQPPYQSVQKTETIHAATGYSETRLRLSPSGFSREIRVSPIGQGANCWVGFRGPFYPEPAVKVSKRESLWTQPVALVEPTSGDECPAEEPMCDYWMFYWNTGWLHATFVTRTEDTLRFATHCRNDTSIEIEWRLWYTPHKPTGSQVYSAPAGYHEETFKIPDDVRSGFSDQPFGYELTVMDGGECWIAMIWDGGNYIFNLPLGWYLP